MCLTKYIARFKRRIFRNRHSLSGNKIVSRQVHLEWWNEKDNIGDYLAVIVFNWMLNKKGISPDKTTHKIIHLMTIGSLIGLSDFDAVIWGAGIHCITSVNGIRARKNMSDMMFGRYADRLHDIFWKTAVIYATV